MWLVQNSDKAMLTIVDPQMTKQEQYETGTDIVKITDPAFKLGDKVLLFAVDDDCGFLPDLYDPELVKDKEFIQLQAKYDLAPKILTVCDHHYL